MRGGFEITRFHVLVSMAFCFAFLFVMPASAAITPDWGATDNGAGQLQFPVAGTKEIANTVLPELNIEGLRYIGKVWTYMDFPGDSDVSPLYKIRKGGVYHFHLIPSYPPIDFDLGVYYKGVWFTSEAGAGYLDCVPLRIARGSRIRFEVHSHNGYGTAVIKIYKKT